MAIQRAVLAAAMLVALKEAVPDIARQGRVEGSK
jgi:hypothetical protein